MQSVIIGVEENLVSVQKKTKSIPLSYYPKQIIGIISFKTTKTMQLETGDYFFIILGKRRSSYVDKHHMAYRKEVAMFCQVIINKIINTDKEKMHEIHRNKHLSYITRPCNSLREDKQCNN